MKRIYLSVLLTLVAVVIILVAWKKMGGNQLYSIDVSRTAVVKQLRALNRYETSSFSIEKIIEARAGQESGLSQILFGDKILLIAYGEVIGGFDLSTLTDKNVQIQNKTITITLPAPVILVTRLDSEKTRVYDRSKGFLTSGDKDLESKARLAAENSIRDAACTSGILKEASDKGRAQLETILKTIGFETVIVNIPVGKCS